MSQQALHYHTNQLIEVKQVEKSTEEGLEWRFTPLGVFILKKIISKTINNSNNTNTTIESALNNDNTFSLEKNRKIQRKQRYFVRLSHI